MSQDSNLGTYVGEEGSLGNQGISAVGMADDVGLLADSLHDLKLLLRLSQDFCAKYNIKLVSGKTKLLTFFPKAMKPEVDYVLGAVLPSGDGGNPDKALYLRQSNRGRQVCLWQLSHDL